MVVLLLVVVQSVGPAGDPGRQQVVGVVGEVVADQDVEQVGVAAQVGVGEHDELAVARGTRRCSAARTRWVASRASMAAATSRDGVRRSGRARAPRPRRRGRRRSGAEQQGRSASVRAQWALTTVARGAEVALTVG